MDRFCVPRLRSERGQTSAEYIGLILVVVAIIAAIGTSGIGAAVAQRVESAICSVGAKSCEQRGGLADGETAGGPDADGDGLSDGEELALGSDARRSDTDGDGLADGEEYQQGTDPTQAVAALTDDNRLRPWERIGMSEYDWRAFEDAVLDEANPDGLEAFLFGRPYFAVDLDENGEIVLHRVMENGVGGLVRVIAGAGKGITAAQAGARAAARLPRPIAARLGRVGVLPTSARTVRPPVPPARPGTAFNALDELGRPTGASATIAPEMIGTGSRAARRIQPPGYSTTAGHARGHLIGRQLGGSGNDPRNLVTLFQRPANSPVMRGFENKVRSAVEGGEVVRYTAQPIYRGSEAIPRAVTLTARGSRGFRLDVTVLNKGG